MTQLMKVLIVEENTVMREKIAGLLSRVEGIDAVSQLSDGRKLAEYMRDENPRIILLDAGVAYREQEKLFALQQANKGIRIIVLMENDKELFLRSGITESIRIEGMINKEDVFSEVKEVVNGMTARDNDSEES